jgi:hypothetical protein
MPKVSGRTKMAKPEVIGSRTIRQTITEWGQYVDIVQGWDGFQNWAFRGQGDQDWPLLPSLSRLVRETSICGPSMRRQEDRIRRIFKRKAHHFLDDPPRDELEWLALMQHHGAPTRLLDLTWSPFVAAFFALERTTVDAAVWAFNLPLMWEGSERAIDGVHVWDADPRKAGIFDEHYASNEHAFVWQGDPFRMPQRVIAQSGTFLVMGNLEQTVQEIFDGYPTSQRGRSPMENALLIQFVFDTAAVRPEAMRSMYSMNITQSTLFPGLDGLARSMRYEFEYSWEVDLETDEVRKPLRDGRVPQDLLTLD